jgi:hypothetical protein
MRQTVNHRTSTIDLSIAHLHQDHNGTTFLVTLSDLDRLPWKSIPFVDHSRKPKRIAVVRTIYVSTAVVLVIEQLSAESE